MKSNCKWGFPFGLVLAAVLYVLPSTGSAFAYTQEQEQACTPDAMRLCGNFIPDVDSITVCMIQKKSQLSPECRRFFPDPEVGARAAKPKKKPARPAAN